MKVKYHIILNQTNDRVSVDIPAFNCSTQGKDYKEAEKMAENAVHFICDNYKLGRKRLPEDNVSIGSGSGIISEVEVDL